MMRYLACLLLLGSGAYASQIDQTKMVDVKVVLYIGDNEFSAPELRVLLGQGGTIDFTSQYCDEAIYVSVVPTKTSGEGDALELDCVVGALIAGKRIPLSEPQFTVTPGSRAVFALTRKPNQESGVELLESIRVEITPGEIYDSI